MPTFIHRVEEHLLGALLTDPGRLAEIPTLVTEHFHDGDHQLIYTALVRAHTGAPDARDAALRERVVSEAGHPAISEERLCSFTWGRIGVDAVADDAQLVQEAALQRELHASADRIAELALALPPDAHKPYLNFARLIERLRLYADNTGPDIDMAYPAEPYSRSRQEELVLAGLIQHPELVAEVSSWLSAEVFTTSERAEIFLALRAVAELEPALERDGVEPLSLIFDLPARAGALIAVRATTRAGQDDPAHHSAELGTGGYLTDLNRLTIDAETTVEIGRDLLGAHIREDLHTGVNSAAYQTSLIEADSGPLAADRGDRVLRHEAYIRYTEGLPPRDNTIDQQVYQNMRQWNDQPPVAPAVSRGGGEVRDERIRAEAERCADRAKHATVRDAVLTELRHAHQRAFEQATGRQYLAGDDPPF